MDTVFHLRCCSVSLTVLGSKAFIYSTIVSQLKDMLVDDFVLFDTASHVLAQDGLEVTM